MPATPRLSSTLRPIDVPFTLRSVEAWNLEIGRRQSTLQFCLDLC